MRSNVFRHLLVVLAFTGVGLAFALLALQKGGGLPSLGDTYRVKAYLPDAKQLATNAQVTMAGLRVGVVKTIERKGAGALVGMTIEEESVRPLPRDSVAAIRARTALGESYIDIVPGTSERDLPSDGLLATASVDTFVDVDEILSVFRGSARTGARQMIQGLARGTQQRGGRLNKVLDDGTTLVTDGAVLVDVLHANRQDVSALIDDLGRVSVALGERDEAIRQLATGGLRSFQALASRDQALRRILDVAPPLLRQTRATTGTIRRTSAQATPVLTDLGHALREVRPAVRQLLPASRGGRAAALELGRTVTPLAGTLKRVQAFAKRSPTVLSNLRKTVCQVNPMVRYLAPYTEDVLGVIRGLGSASNSYDATGHLIRLFPMVDENTIAGLPDEVSQAAFRLVHSGLLGTTTGRLEWDPLPPPGGLGTTRARAGGATGPEDLARKGFKYPRIHADC